MKRDADMNKILASLTLISAVAVAAPASAATLFAVDEVNNIVQYDSTNPGVTISSVAIAGVSGSSILAMDFRIADGKIYALTDDYRLFSVNPFTGATTLKDTLALSGTNFAFDFNPVNTNLRIVSNDDTNYVYNFTTNTLVPGANVAYGVGPAAKDITAAGYLNNDNDILTGTTLYVLDSRNDLLATQNPTTGVLTQVGALGIDIGARTSFDILTTGSLNETFIQNGTGLYSIDLTTGTTTLLGNSDRALFAMTAIAIPEPTTWAMVIAGFGLVGGALRRKQRPAGTPVLAS